MSKFIEINGTKDELPEIIITIDGISHRYTATKDTMAKISDTGKLIPFLTPKDIESIQSIIEAQNKKIALLEYALKAVRNELNEFRQATEIILRNLEAVINIKYIDTKKGSMAVDYVKIRAPKLIVDTLHSDGHIVAKGMIKTEMGFHCPKTQVISE